MTYVKLYFALKSQSLHQEDVSAEYDLQWTNHPRNSYLNLSITRWPYSDGNKKNLEKKNSPKPNKRSAFNTLDKRSMSPPTRSLLDRVSWSIRDTPDDESFRWLAQYSNSTPAPCTIDERVAASTGRVVRQQALHKPPLQSWPRDFFSRCGG